MNKALDYFSDSLPVRLYRILAISLIQPEV